MKTQQGYKARTLPYLPLEWKLESGTTLSVDYMTNEQFMSGYDIIQDAAKHGDNVGTDEFSDVTRYESLLKYAHCFALMEHRGGEKPPPKDNVSAMILIKPDSSLRSPDYIISQNHIFMSHGFKSTHTHLLPELIRLAEKLTIDLGLGYIGTVIQVAIPCIDWLTALRGEGYVTTAVLPKSLMYTNRGLVENCRLFKKLVSMRPKRDLKDIMKMLGTDTINIERFNTTALPEIESLPLYYKFRNGLCGRLRNYKHSDVPGMYKTFLEVVKSGDAFSSDEIPNLNYFHQYYVKSTSYVCTIEELHTQEVIANIIINPTIHVRTSQRVSADITLMVESQFRGKGLGHELVAISAGLGKSLGYSSVLGDTLINTVRSRSLARSTKDAVVVGVLPFGAHNAKLGWLDLVIDYTPLDHKKDIREICTLTKAML